MRAALIAFALCATMSMVSGDVCPAPVAPVATPTPTPYPSLVQPAGLCPSSCRGWGSSFNSALNWCVELHYYEYVWLQRPLPVVSCVRRISAPWPPKLRCVHVAVCLPACPGVLALCQNISFSVFYFVISGCQCRAQLAWSLTK